MFIPTYARRTVEPSQGARSHPAEIAPSLVEVKLEGVSKHILFQNYIGRLFAGHAHALDD